MISNEVKILKICLSGLAEISFLESFLYSGTLSLSSLFLSSCCFCACIHHIHYSPRSQGTENLVSEFHLCCLFCYQVSCFCACLHSVHYSPRSQGTDNLVLEFLVRLGENLELYLLLIGLFFLNGKDKQRKFQ